MINVGGGPVSPTAQQIYCIDDSATARRLLYCNLTTRAKTRNVHVFGEDETDMDLFIPASLSNGDIVILDQHLEYGGDSNILGTDLVKRLVAQVLRPAPIGVRTPEEMPLPFRMLGPLGGGSLDRRQSLIVLLCNVRVGRGAS